MDLDARYVVPPFADGHGLNPALVAEIVRRAHTAGVRVAAHVETAFDFEVAQLAGERVVVVTPTAFLRDRATASDTGWANCHRA